MPSLTIGRLAKATDVKIPTIRFYEQIGLLPTPQRTVSDRRLYGEDAVRRLTFIKQARDLGFAVESIRTLLDFASDRETVSDEASALLRQQLKEVERKIARLNALHGELKSMLDRSTIAAAGCGILPSLADANPPRRRRTRSVVSELIATCTHDRGPTSTSAERAKRLRLARRLCEAQGQRWTVTRSRTMELLLAADCPVKAYDLLAAYGGRKGPAKPATIYRALEFLIAQGLAHRVESRNAFVACQDPEHRHLPEFMICDCCGRAEERMTELKLPTRTSSDSGFEAVGGVVELSGRCAACREAQT